MRSSTEIYPKEMIRECVTRLPIAYHPVVSAVSEDIHDYITSRKIYDVRVNNTHHTETVIHVGLLSEESLHNPSWYALYKKPYQEEYIFRSIPQFPVLYSLNHSMVAYGSKIYAVGGSIVGSSTSSEVICIDCARYVRVPAPSTNGIHSCPDIALVEGCLYVMGGCEPCTFLECLDLANHKEEWNVVTPSVEPQPITSNSCVINNRVFSIEREKRIVVHVNKGTTLTPLRGLEEMQAEFSEHSTTLMNISGKLMILQNSNPRKIVVTVITLEERGGEMWGKVSSSNVALELTYPTSILHALEVEL